MWETEDSRHLLKTAMPMVLSALFWLENLEANPDPTPGRDTSSERVAHWANANAQGRAKLRRKLKEEGYALVYLVDHQAAASEQSGEVGGMVSPHFRRAHWRMQQYGPRAAPLKKRIRIAQTYVNPRQEPLDTAISGHIYIPGSERKQ